jgi:hypothetical protein
MKCEIEGCTASRFYEGGTMHTLMCVERYIENDRKHVHDPNQHGTDYTCSNGHRFTVGPFYKPCPVADCEWNKKRINNAKD